MRTDRWIRIKKSISGFITFQFEEEQKIHQIPARYSIRQIEKYKIKQKTKKKKEEQNRRNGIET